MTQSQSTTAAQGALLSTCLDAFTVFEVVASLRSDGKLTPGVLAVAKKQLNLCERRAQDFEADLASLSNPTSVWFDLMPNEWCFDVDWPSAN